MVNKGFIRVATGVIDTEMCDCRKNAELMVEAMRKADRQGAQLITFPELSMTGYAIGDMIQYRFVLNSCVESLAWLADETRNLDIIGVIGLPIEVRGLLLNAAAVIHNGSIIAAVPKTYIPNYKEFYEERWYASGDSIGADEIEIAGQNVPFGQGTLIQTNEFTFGIEICEDLWAPIPVSSRLALMGAEVIVNLSASDEVLNKHSHLKNIVRHQSSALNAAYIYCSAGGGESSTDLLFTGKAGIAECGDVLAETERFEDGEKLIYADIDIDRIRAERLRCNTFWHSAAEMPEPRIVRCKNNVKETRLERNISPSPYFCTERSEGEQCQEMFDIQVTALMRKLKNTHIGNIVVGISGGLDSTLALLVATETFRRLGISPAHIHAVTMPGYGTSERTHTNAHTIMKRLGVTTHEIPIAEACDLHFRQIGHDKEIHDTTYENVQARQRTFILMNLANKYNGLVLGTGDLSEMALGWATFNGDQMSMYGINCGIPKTLVRKIVEYIASLTIDKELSSSLRDIVDTPISPELVPMDGGQVTEDFVGPYPLHDFYIFYTLKYGYGREKVIEMAKIAFRDQYSESEIEKWYDTFWRRFRRQQFKRSCLPDGPKVTCISLSPRGDLRMPSDLK